MDAEWRASFQALRKGIISPEAFWESFGEDVLFFRELLREGLMQERRLMSATCPKCHHHLGAHYTYNEKGICEVRVTDQGLCGCNHRENQPT